MTEHTSSHILTVKKLSKRFGKIEVLKNISLSIGTGGIYAIIGPNGAGKTTLFNLVTGIIEKDRGTVLYYKDTCDERNENNSQMAYADQSVDISVLEPRHIARLGIGRTFQGNRIFSNMTVLENVMVGKPLIELENPFGIMKSSHNIIIEQLEDRNGAIAKRKYNRDIEEVLRDKALNFLDFVGLSGVHDKKAEELSYGQQKLLSIARLLMADCRLLLFDEPTAGVNIKYATKIAEIFKKLVNKGNKTILFIEHDMKFIQKLNCKCLYLENGRCPWPFYELSVIMRNPNIRKKFMGM